MGVHAMKFCLMGAAALAAIGVTDANASFIINIDQVGSNVVASGSGSFNLTGLTDRGNGGYAIPQTTPEFGILDIGGANHTPVEVYTILQGPTSFGTGWISFSSTETGPLVGISPAGQANNEDLFLPPDYIGGTTITNSDTWESATLDSLGLTPGTYTWTWGTGANADSLTVNVVPEPAMLAVFGIPALLLVGLRRRTGLSGGRIG